MKIYYQKCYDNYAVLKKVYKVYDFRLFKIKKKQKPIVGSNNQFYTIQNGKKIQITELPSNVISIEGDNNVIFVHDISSFKNNFIQILGNNNMIEIMPLKTPMRDVRIWFRGKANNRQLTIGKNTVIAKGNITVYEDNISVTIGNDCLFSSDWEIRTTDGHDIYDLKNDKIINKSKSISIGNNVWICSKTTFIKGAEVPDNCVIGTQSVVNKKFTKNHCIIAGIPARIVKEDIYWK